MKNTEQKTDKIKETLNTFTVLNEHAVLLDYRADYRLDEMIASGKTSLIPMARQMQKLLHTGRFVINPSAHGACSTFNVRSDKNDVLMGRNFDFKEARCMVLWTHPKNAYSSLAIVNQNLLLHLDMAKSSHHLRCMGAPYASMDGINDQGLAAAILEIITKPTRQSTGKTPITTNVALRAILDTCKNVDEAIAFLEKYDMHDLLGACYHYHFTDADNKSAIVEYMDGKMYVYYQDKIDESLKLTNFFITEGGDNSHEKGRDRYEKLDCILKEKSSLSEDEAMKALEDVQVFYRSKYKIYNIATLWSAVYNCTERKATLCFAREFNKKYRFSVDKPLEYEII